MSSSCSCGGKFETQIPVAARDDVYRLDFGIAPVVLRLLSGQRAARGREQHHTPRKPSDPHVSPGVFLMISTNHPNGHHLKTAERIKPERNVHTESHERPFAGQHSKLFRRLDRAFQ